MDELERSGVLSERTFSFCMTGLGSNTSSVDFGKPQPSKMVNAGFNISPINLGFYDDFFWSSSILAYSLGVTGGSNAF